MKQISVLKDFRFAENGHLFREFKAGEVANVTDACATSAAQMGVAEDFRLNVEPSEPWDRAQRGEVTENSKAKGKK